MLPTRLVVIWPHRPPFPAGRSWHRLGVTRCCIMALGHIFVCSIDYLFASFDTVQETFTAQFHTGRPGRPQEQCSSRQTDSMLCSDVMDTQLFVIECQPGAILCKPTEACVSNASDCVATFVSDTCSSDVSEAVCHCASMDRGRHASRCQASRRLSRRSQSSLGSRRTASHRHGSWHGHGMVRSSRRAI